MALDVQTLFVTMMINLLALSLAVPIIMGWHASPAARLAQGALVLQSLGWACLLLSRVGPDRLLSTLAVLGLCSGQALLWQCMRGWLGPRPGGWLVWGLALAVPLGYGLGFHHYAFRAGWSNIGLALQMATVCVALVWPAPQASPRWRWIMAISLGALAVATAWRGVLGGFFTASYPSLRTPHPVNLGAALLGNLTVVLNGVGLLVAWREEAERALLTLARTDGLTGLLNRRALRDGAIPLIALARRHRQPLALLLFDLDHFKQVNDRHGHEAGDRALVLAATTLQQALRQGDLAARWGGEEFCVLLVQGDADAAVACFHRVRDALRRQTVPGFDMALDMSAGATTLQGDDDTLDALLRRADAGLYAAKAAGRGQLVQQA